MLRGEPGDGVVLMQYAAPVDPLALSQPAGGDGEGFGVLPHLQVAELQRALAVGEGESAAALLRALLAPHLVQVPLARLVSAGEGLVSPCLTLAYGTKSLRSNQTSP